MLADSGEGNMDNNTSAVNKYSVGDRVLVDLAFAGTVDRVSITAGDQALYRLELDEPRGLDAFLSPTTWFARECELAPLADYKHCIRCLKFLKTCDYFYPYNRGDKTYYMSCCKRCNSTGSLAVSYRQKAAAGTLQRCLEGLRQKVKLAEDILVKHGNKCG